jgi:hypothetical protein
MTRPWFTRLAWTLVGMVVGAGGSAAFTVVWAYRNYPRLANPCPVTP